MLFGIPSRNKVSKQVSQSEKSLPSELIKELRTLAETVGELREQLVAAKEHHELLEETLSEQSRKITELDKVVAKKDATIGMLVESSKQIGISFEPLVKQEEGMYRHVSLYDYKAFEFIAIQARNLLDGKLFNQDYYEAMASDVYADFAMSLPGEIGSESHEMAFNRISEVSQDFNPKADVR